MAKIEKVVVITLILTALVGITISYYQRSLKRKIVVIPDESTQPAEKAKEIIAERKIININTADKETLATLPGVGPHLAQRIIDYRQEHGRFNLPEDILKVKGIGPKKYDSMKDCIRVDE